MLCPHTRDTARPMFEAFAAAPFAHAVGFAGTAAGICWPLFCGRCGMLLAQLVAGAAFAAHFALLGAETGAVMNVLATLQVAAAIPLGTRPGFRVVYLALLPIIAVAAMLTWNGTPSLLAAFGLAFVSLSRYQIAVVPFRLFMAAALPCWFGHNLLVGSVPGMISDVTGTVINLWMLARLGVLRLPPLRPAKEGASPPPP